MVSLSDIIVPGVMTYKVLGEAAEDLGYIARVPGLKGIEKATGALALLAMPASLTSAYEAYSRIQMGRDSRADELEVVSGALTVLNLGAMVLCPQNGLARFGLFLGGLYVDAGRIGLAAQSGDGADTLLNLWTLVVFNFDRSSRKNLADSFQSVATRFELSPALMTPHGTAISARRSLWELLSAPMEARHVVTRADIERRAELRNQLERQQQVFPTDSIVMIWEGLRTVLKRVMGVKDPQLAIVILRPPYLQSYMQPLAIDLDRLLQQQTLEALPDVFGIHLRDPDLERYIGQVSDMLDQKKNICVPAIPGDLQADHLISALLAFRRRDNAHQSFLAWNKTRDEEFDVDQIIAARKNDGLVFLDFANSEVAPSVIKGIRDQSASHDRAHLIMLVTHQDSSQPALASVAKTVYPWHVDYTVACEVIQNSFQGQNISKPAVDRIYKTTGGNLMTIKTFCKFMREYLPSSGLITEDLVSLFDLQKKLENVPLQRDTLLENLGLRRLSNRGLSVFCTPEELRIVQEIRSSGVDTVNTPTRLLLKLEGLGWLYRIPSGEMELTNIALLANDIYRSS